MSSVKVKRLIKLGQEVLQYYMLPPLKIKVIQRGGKKVVWKFTSKGKDFCLKRLNRPLGQALFVAEA